MNCKTQVRGGLRRFRWLSLVFFLVVCGCLFLGQAAVAQNLQDQCVGALVNSGTLGRATGCGVVITVTSVDEIGHATAFSVVPTGNGNPYDGVEDTLVGVQNSSNGTLNSMTITSSGSPGAFAFDGDGPCALHSFTWCPDVYPSILNDPNPVGYEGPNNTFTRNNTSSGTVNFSTPIPVNGSTWFALEGTPQSLTGGNFSQTITKALTPTETDFQFTTPNAMTIQKIIYTNSGTDPTTNHSVMQVTLRQISDTEFQNLVAGTFAQGSSCMPQDLGNGNFACAVTIALCTNDTNSIPQGENCPQSSAAATSIIGVDMKYSTTFGDPSSVPTPGYLAATDDALTCGADIGNTCRKLHNIFTGIADDCCTTSGGTKSFNSLFVPVSNLQTWYQPAGTMCNGDAGHQILQPVNADGTSVWKVGRTIPLKFRVCNANGVSVGTAGVITSFQLVSIAQGTVVTVVDETAAATTIDNGFRFDPTGQQWIFNLSTKNFSAPATYVYQINLNDGTQINFQFGLR